MLTDISYQLSVVSLVSRIERADPFLTWLIADS
jgi:hypothetical protein